MGLVGGVIGGPPAGLVADKWGRKISVMVNGVLYATGYTLIAFAKVQTLSPLTFKAILMVGRFITGIGSGWSFVSTPVSCTLLGRAEASPTLVCSIEIFSISIYLSIYICMCRTSRLNIRISKLFNIQRMR